LQCLATILCLGQEVAGCSLRAERSVNPGPAISPTNETGWVRDCDLIIAYIACTRTRVAQHICTAEL
jgi:hypothetical protein